MDEAPGRTAVDQDALPSTGASLLTYPASIPLSTRSLTRLTELVRDRRRALGGRWRRLPAQQQALMALAHLRNGDTLSSLAAGFAVSVATVWRYLREAVDLLAG